MSVIRVGDILPFFAPFNLSYPKRETAAVVLAVNDDGTVDVEGEDGTPHSHVVLIDAGDPYEGGGPFAIRPSKAAVEEFAPPPTDDPTLPATTSDAAPTEADPGVDA